MTSLYGTTVIADKINAATPITGGIICPPEEAAASTPPENTFAKPLLSIMGIVRAPVDKTFTIGPPEIVPNIAELTMAAWAGPPLRCLVHRKAILISDLPPAETPNNDPKTIYGKTVFIRIFINLPSKPCPLLTKISLTAGLPSDSNLGSPPNFVIKYLFMSSAP